MAAILCAGFGTTNHDASSTQDLDTRTTHTLSITFDELVTAGTGSVVVQRASDNQKQSFDVTTADVTVVDRVRSIILSENPF